MCVATDVTSANTIRLKTVTTMPAGNTTRSLLGGSRSSPHSANGTIFAQPDRASAMTQLHEVARMLGSKVPQIAELLEEAAEDVLAHLLFPMEHRRRLHSTNPLERLRKEIERRTRVVGIFPTRDSLMRMVGTLLAEQDDEWQVSVRRYFSAGSMAKVDAIDGGEDPKELLAQFA